MNRFDLKAYVYLSIETSQRYTVSRRFEFPTGRLQALVDDIKTACTLVQIGLNALAWGLR